MLFLIALDIALGKPSDFVPLLCIFRHFISPPVNEKKDHYSISFVTAI